jgi:hypothetical protein
MNAHEMGFTTFLSEPGQRRLRTLFELGPKRRKDIRALLDHAVTLNPRYCRPLGKPGQEEPLYQRLLSLGAPERCFIISADPDLDGKEMDLVEALNAVSGSGHGRFVSCIPGRLGYFAYEDGRRSFLLHK